MPELNKYELLLTLDEAECLYRIVCEGLLGGSQETKSRLYKKVAMLKENAQLGRAAVCTRTIARTTPALSNGNKKARV